MIAPSNIGSIKISELLFSFALLISLFSYEKTVYAHFYSFMILIALAFGSVALIVCRDRATFKNALESNVLVIILAMVQLVAGIIAMVVGNYSSTTWIATVAMTFVSLLVFYIYVPRVREIRFKLVLTMVVYVTTAASALGVAIYLLGSFGGYSMLWGTRSPSIFFDANYFGSIAAVAAAFLFFCPGKISKALTVVNIAGVVCSGSRGAVLSVCLAVGFILVIRFLKKKSIRSFAAIVIVAVAIYFAFGLLSDAGFFRTDQASNGRLEMWSYYIQAILDSPIWGYGFGSTSSVLASFGIDHTSTHNAYLDYAAMYGVPALAIYISIILRSFYRSKTLLDSRMSLYVSSVVLLCNAMTISINLGGLGFLSLFLTLNLGLLNAGESCRWEGDTDGQRKA